MPYEVWGRTAGVYISFLSIHSFRNYLLYLCANLLHAVITALISIQLYGYVPGQIGTDANKQMLYVHTYIIYVKYTYAYLYTYVYLYTYLYLGISISIAISMQSNAN